jgi:hypothetical protein
MELLVLTNLALDVSLQIDLMDLLKRKVRVLKKLIAKA